MFPLPEVQDELKKYVLVQLYVEDKDHADIQDRLIKRSDLPSYVAVKSDGETVIKFVGYETKPNVRVSSFVSFLSDSFDAAAL